MPRRTAEPVEVAELRGFLRHHKRTLTYEQIARWGLAGQKVSVSSLSQALNGRRLPTLRVVVAFTTGAVRAHAAGFSKGGAAAQDLTTAENTARERWEAAMDALARAPAAPNHAPVRGRYTPAARTTPLTKAMARIHAGAGTPSLRALARSPKAAGRFSHSALHNALTGRRVPAEDVLTAFAEACGAAPDTTAGLLDARRRVLNVPARPQPVLYTGCLDHLAEPDPEHDAEGRRWPWLPPAPEPDWYEEQLHDEAEADHYHRHAWIYELTDAELRDIQEQHKVLGAGRDLRAEVRALAARA